MISFKTQIVKDQPVTANPTGLWTLAAEFVEGSVLLKVNAISGTWQYSDTSEQCTADGDTKSLIARSRTLFPGAPVGALIGKVGGSSAGIADGTVFLAGNTCIFKIPDGGGPLYFTINDEYTGMANNKGTITVNAWIGRGPEPTPVPPASPAPV